MQNQQCEVIAESKLSLLLSCFQDVLVHIRDISHPDAVAQKLNVLQTLQHQNVDTKLLDNMIEVCNKVDKVNER